MREAAQRALAMRHYDVQLYGGIAMSERSVAEMQTGEGKTLTATLPLYLAALSGEGAHLATANDYLACRDAELMRPAFEMLGLTVGSVEASSSRGQRQQAYSCDVTYGAAREFGFDFLRDRLQRAGIAEQHDDLLGRMLGCHESDSGGRFIQRELAFMLVDEADSVLIDEARTPLVVSAVPGDSEQAATALYEWAASVTEQFTVDTDFAVSAAGQVVLNAAGRRRVRELKRPGELAAAPLLDVYEFVERAIYVARSFHRDQHYVVRSGEVVIVDENTGRLAEGRKWRDGLHQAIEAREGLTVTVKTGEAARVTVQDFFLRYRQLAGMTGTASSSRSEFMGIYGLKTQVIPTHLPVQREHLPDRVFATEEAKWKAVVQEIVAVQRAGRPVLIGTRSIAKSEALSAMLCQASIEHEVLNASRHTEEAAIVARAGEPGRVTVATNMAGRGTDIKLGEGVTKLGGLHVIGTELHDSQRIDRQLYGRCARQGDPGSVQQFMSLEDEVLDPPAGQTQDRSKQVESAAEITGKTHLFRRAQARIERRHFRQRRILLYHEKQRQEAQREMGQDPHVG